MVNHLRSNKPCIILRRKEIIFQMNMIFFTFRFEFLKHYFINHLKLQSCWWECFLFQPPWKTVWGILIDLELSCHKIHQFYTPELKKRKSIQEDARILLFIYALSMIAKIWNQPRYTITGKRIMKVWYNTMQLQGNYTFCCNLVGTQRYQVEQDKPEEDKPDLCLIYKIMVLGDIM